MANMRNKKTALMAAYTAKNMDAMRDLLTQTTPLSTAYFAHNDSILHIAARDGRLDAVDVILDVGFADLNAKNAYRETPLLVGALHPEICSRLIAAGANPDIRDDFEKTYMDRRYEAQTAASAPTRIKLSYKLRKNTPEQS